MIAGGRYLPTGFTPRFWMRLQPCLSVPTATVTFLSWMWAAVRATMRAALLKPCPGRGYWASISTAKLFRPLRAAEIPSTGLWPTSNGCPCQTALDTVLDVLTPADYAEFRRVLAPGGELYKVVPGADYLREVRAAVSGHLRGGDAYDNGRVLTHLSQHAVILEHAVIHETFPLSQEQAERFLRMTPMTFSVPENALEARALDRITIHLELLRCRMG